MKQTNKKVTSQSKESSQGNNQHEAIFEDADLKFKTIFDTASIGILIAQSSYRNFLYSNQKMCDMLGYSKHEILKLKVSDIHPEESLPYIFDQFDKIINKEISEMHNLPFKRKDQSVFFADGNASYVTFKGKKCLVGMFKDVTESYQAENLIRQRESDLAEAQRVASLGYWSYDLNTQVVNWSDGLYRIIDIGKEDFDGSYDSFLSYVHPDDKATVMEANRHALASGEPFEIEYRILTKNHQLKNIREVGYAKKDISDKMIGLFGTAQGITRIRLTEEKLRESEKRLSSLADHLSNAVIYQLTVEPDGVRRFTYISGAVERINEVKEDIVLADANVIYNQVLPEYRELVRQREEEALQNLTTLHVDVQCRLPSGRLCWFEYISTPRRQADGSLVWDGVEMDITQRKEAEISLSKSEKKFSSIFHFNPDPIAITEIATGKIIDVNDAFLIWTGYSRGEVINASTHDLRLWVNPEDRKKIVSALSATGEVIGEEIIMRQKNGNIRNILFSACFVDIDDARHLLTLAHDITERKQAEEKLRREEQRFRALAEQAPDMIVLINREFKVTYINPAVEDFLGLSQEDIIGMDMYKYLHPDDVERIANVFTTFFKNSSPNMQKAEIRIYHKDGTWHLLEAIGTNLVHHHVAEAVIVNLRDITERKRANEQLLLIQKAVNSSSDPIGISDPQARHFYQNKAFTELFEYTAEELDEAGGGPAVYVDQEAAREVFDIIMKGGSWNGEVEMISKSGRKFPVYQRADAIKDESGKIIGLIGIETDITERKQMEHQLQASESNFRHSLDESPLGVRISTLEGETIYANRAILDIYEYENIEELKRTSIKERYTPESYAEFQERKKKRLNGETGPSEYEISIIRKNGAIRNLQVFRKEIFWNGKKQSQVIYQDITERKQAEEKLQKTLETLKKAVGTTIHVLVSVLESRDPYTAGHQSRSADLACAIATEMGLSQDQIEGIRMAGSIHDIGKLAIPAEILSKPTKLTDLEFSLVKEHSQSGYDMLKDVESPWPLADIVGQHHERINGTGYPKQLKGNDILVEARIMAVADVVEAMASHRPYRASLGLAAALEEIEKNKGILYDETVVDACLTLFRKNGYKLT